MIDRKALLTDLIKQVKAAEADLGQQVADGEALLKPLRTEFGELKDAGAWSPWLEEKLAEVPEERADRLRAAEAVAGRLRAEYDTAFKLGRTGATWSAWLGERVTQVAVAWVLGTVFVRFCEDNRLIPEPFLAGAEEERRDLAEARYAQYVEVDPDPTYRGWLEQAFDEIGAGQAGKLLFDRRHNPLYQIPLSHDGARALVQFWRERREDGSLVHDFTDPLNEDGTEGWDTRFLGDLYQDLSESARKTYALLQTPEFVEEFILDRTMNPVVREMGDRFGELKMIDPTCGSGHFVLGAFRRMVRLFAERRPGQDLHERVRMALDAVHGVDINPFAVAIARFRLLLAGMAAANVRTLAHANRYDWPIHMAVGDSLITDRQTEIGVRNTTGQGELEFATHQSDEATEFTYSTENTHEHAGILTPGRYDIVVGNPPYITVKDSRLNKLYRKLYKSCSGSYALSVPFAERFFQLAKGATLDGTPYGMVGQITANSFMKREFGTKLIEEFFAHKVELTEVVDTSGAYVPGHGTPTVILIGRRRSGAARESTVRTVRSVRGEPTVPDDPARGLVWHAISHQIDLPGSKSAWVSVDDLDRTRYFNRQPWVLADGGLEMIETLNKSAKCKLAAITEVIGAGAVTREDDVYMIGRAALERLRVEPEHQRFLVEGTEVRDYSLKDPVLALWPYSETTLRPHASTSTERILWPYRARLRSRVAFGKNQIERGLNWFEYSMFFRSRFNSAMSLAFPFVATHNHFFLNQTQKVFIRTAPTIILRGNAGTEDYLELLGALNSSTACFWLKQVSHNKGSTIDTRGARQSTVPFEDFYEFTGTKLGEFPIPFGITSELPAQMQDLALELADSAPQHITRSTPPLAMKLKEAHSRWEKVRAKLIALQEEADWQFYRLYRLLDVDLCVTTEKTPDIALGQRAFEIVLARRVARGEASDEWFKRHGSTPITEIPEHWPDAYKEVVQKRIDAIESNRAIGMIERPEYKRRWATEGWDVLQERALRNWLLDRMESRGLWFQDEQPTILTKEQLTSALALDEDFVSVAELYAPRKELGTVVSDLLADEHVPFLAALRYKPAGMKKRADWEHVWQLQREEDAAPDEPAKRKIRDSIPVPPKYTSADFLKPSYWRARGKLDVPKERFISYATRAISGVPELFGWAGWDHREQAQALATYFTNHDELSAEEMTPLLAGLLELQPWLGQWHDEFDPLYGGSPAAFFQGYRTSEQGKHGLTDDDLRAWRPAPAARRGRKKAGDS
ncbi:BREX-2 system adenine-specific DNA-methyltransferase PglX [Streptomyces marincola]|uniref:BREX-2 system adenine-specific DNA-methyltransferase PglX n=1 Tax=Streptomyces marincola TaxID=2878388 RepID=UPI001CF1A3DC|nr:BREX-2 system adenine-specific DNA-methyltransferase PglX [Streptomyces marincola]UCM87231.1 BREX-2 system adenine-specific DNA-methyltransferase PglX [Streptomyces marincola]